MKRALLTALWNLAVCLLASPALASYHIMKIEQAIGGVAGDTSQQAIQLRLRAAGQNEVGTNQARLIVRDATGSNPVTLIVFPTDAAIGTQGSRILVASSAFATAQPTITADFTMTNTIPPSYLAAGRLTFEDNAGTILWSLAWGGASYTGSNLGDPSHFNDADGNFGPPFASPLPSTTTQALRFTTADATGAALSTNNAADYGVSAGAASFTNNAGASGTVAGPQSDLSVTKTAIPDPVAPSQPVTYSITVANSGPAVATSVLVSDTLPPGSTFMGASGTGWTCGVSPGIATCNRATLAVGTAPLITLVLGAPATPGPITNTVTVSATSTDPSPKDNTASVTTQVSSTPGLADLSITKSDGGLPGRYGYPLTYTITVANGGPASVGGATVTDNFPAGLSDVAWTCQATAGSSCPASGTGNLAALVSLVSGGSARFLATGTVVAGTPSPLLNTAAVAAPAGVVDPSPGSNSATVSTVVGAIAFHTIDPCRLADTRDPAGPAGGPALSANATRSFPVTGRCGIPADARAVSINLAVVGPTDVGDLRIYPAGAAAPLASVVNFGAGAVRANNAILGLGAGGQIAVQCDMPPGSTGVTHFLMDVNAYFR